MIDLFYPLRGRLVIRGGPSGFHFFLVPEGAMIGLTSSQPVYQLAIPGELITWDWPEPPEVSR